jgi:hypothetical protein
MEPADLNSSHPDDARLEAWLRAHSAAAPLPDDGFSARVLAALPARTQPALSANRFAARRTARRRLWLCLLGALAGMALGVTANRGASPTDIGHAFGALLPPLAAAFDRLATPSITLAAAATVVSLAVAYWPALVRLQRSAA